MHRGILVLLLTAGPALAATSWHTQRTWSHCQQMLSKEAHRCAMLDQAMRRQRQFFTFMVDIVEQVRDGVIHLSQATTRVHDYAAVHNPTFLEYLDLHEVGRTVHEKVARCLVRHFEETGPWNSPWTETTAFQLRMEQELDEIAAAGS